MDAGPTPWREYPPIERWAIHLQCLNKWCWNKLRYMGALTWRPIIGRLTGYCFRHWLFGLTLRHTTSILWQSTRRPFHVSSDKRQYGEYWQIQLPVTLYHPVIFGSRCYFAKRVLSSEGIYVQNCHCLVALDLLGLFDGWNNACMKLCRVADMWPDRATPAESCSYSRFTKPIIGELMHCLIPIAFGHMIVRLCLLRNRLRNDYL